MKNALYQSTALSVAALAAAGCLALARPAIAQSMGAGGPGGSGSGSGSSSGSGLLPPTGPGNQGIMCQVMEAWFNGNSGVYAPGTPPFAPGFTAVTPQTSVGSITEPTGNWEVRVVVTTSPAPLANKDLYFMNVLYNGSLATYPYPQGGYFGSCKTAQTSADALAAQWSAQYSPDYYGGCPVQKANGC